VKWGPNNFPGAIASRCGYVATMVIDFSKIIFETECAMVCDYKNHITEGECSNYTLDDVSLYVARRIPITTARKWGVGAPDTEEWEKMNYTEKLTEKHRLTKKISVERRREEYERVRLFPVQVAEIVEAEIVEAEVV
jgi:hypothetical protein